METKLESRNASAERVAQQLSSVAQELEKAQEEALEASTQAQASPLNWTNYARHWIPHQHQMTQLQEAQEFFRLHWMRKNKNPPNSGKPWKPNA